jgi:trimethylamine:corrinoid methyltransferase-like protein
LRCKKWAEQAHLMSLSHSNRCDNHEAEQNMLEMFGLGEHADPPPGLIPDDRLTRAEVQNMMEMLRGEFREQLSSEPFWKHLYLNMVSPQQKCICNKNKQMHM